MWDLSQLPVETSIFEFGYVNILELHSGRFGETVGDIGPEDIELIQGRVDDYRDLNGFFFVRDAKGLEVGFGSALIVDHGNIC